MGKSNHMGGARQLVQINGSHCLIRIRVFRINWRKENLLSNFIVADKMENWIIIN